MSTEMELPSLGRSELFALLLADNTPHGRIAIEEIERLEIAKKAAYSQAMQNGGAYQDAIAALSKLVNEPQDITSKAYQQALVVLRDFDEANK